MSYTRILDHDPARNQTIYWHKLNDGSVVIEEKQHDVSPILEANKTSFNSVGKRDVRGKWAAHVASIPCQIQVQWMESDGFNPSEPLTSEHNWPIVKRLLNSSDWRYLRTSELYL